MRTSLLLLCGLAAWLHVSRQAAPKVAEDPLRPLAPFVGPTWEARFPKGDLTDTQEFVPMFGGKFLRNAHRVCTQAGQVVYEGETIYGWDAREKKLRWWYFNATGGWIDGTVNVEADGSLVFEGENHAAAEQTARVRSTSRLDARRQWHATTWFWREGEWRPERELVYAPKP